MLNATQTPLLSKLNTLDNLSSLGNICDNGLWLWTQAEAYPLMAAPRLPSIFVLLNGGIDFQGLSLANVVDGGAGAEVDKHRGEAESSASIAR